MTEERNDGPPLLFPFLSQKSAHCREISKEMFYFTPHHTTHRHRLCHRRLVVIGDSAELDLMIILSSLFFLSEMVVILGLDFKLAT